MKLDAIANDMRQVLEREPLVPHCWTSHTLNGLEIVLARQQEAWRLALRRRDGQPSENEIESCARAFRVPEGTEPERRQKTEVVVPGMRPVRVHIAELHWREIR